MNLTSAVEGRWQGLFAEDRAATEKTLEAHAVVLSRPQLRSARIVCRDFLPATALFHHATIAAPALCSHAAVAASPHVHSTATRAVAAPALCSHAAVAAAAPALCSHIAAAATWIEDVMLQRGKL
ncbi:hypothetical protein E2562_035578 [Oryza meyeriana var. granulata]|uniref:Uncharacterized protein n=1 Tax=Oryza meyeriana var. granulata TaxID=110450 RepID=A0A6G1ESR3_9ORYZ|nr:hypothetical protein E2562_035578 [Oryza meyeriana var. granulata]